MTTVACGAERKIEGVVEEDRNKATYLGKGQSRWFCRHWGSSHNVNVSCPEVNDSSRRPNECGRPVGPGENGRQAGDWPRETFKASEVM